MNTLASHFSYLLYKPIGLREGVNLIDRYNPSVSGQVLRTHTPARVNKHVVIGEGVVPGVVINACARLDKCLSHTDKF